MADEVARHYSENGSLTDTIAESLRKAGKNTGELKPADLATIDEFHIRGRQATQELAAKMNLGGGSRVLDVGSGLGGPARTLAETYGCHVTGVDLTPAFCETANALSAWVGLAQKTEFRQGDATNLPFPDDQFDAAMTIHAGMNIAAKDAMYEQVGCVVKPKGVFAVYDVLQGEGGEVHFPVPWARDRSISHLATPHEMERLLSVAGFKILESYDSTDESQTWFEKMAAQMAESGPPPVTFQLFLGDDFPVMARNQVRNLAERRIRTISYICEA